jgi:hypothetical protein
MSKGVNFAKDYKKDSYNKNKLMRKNLKDKYELAALKKHSCTLKMSNFKL